VTILGVETSHSVCSVGLLSERGAEERTFSDSHIHSEQILSLVKELCSVSEIDGVAVSIGPGSFTGLRVGMSTAKGLCYSLDIPLLAVQTFHAIAFHACNQFPQVRKIGVCIDAKQGDCYVAKYEKVDGNCILQSDVTIAPLQNVLQYFGKETEMIVTDIKNIFQSASFSTLSVDVRKFLSGRVIAELGKQLYMKKEFADIATLEPFYLKDFVVHQRK
jgi:tRNA threonylcarbamoyladenosine biosynthesis protein TsaB